MMNIKVSLYLLPFYMLLSCNNEEKTSINIHIIDFIKSNKYKTYYEAKYIPKFILENIVYKNDPNPNFEDLGSVEKYNYKIMDEKLMNPNGKKYLHTVLLSKNVCLISYNVFGDVYSTNYVDFYIFKNPQFHKKFKADGVVNTKDSIIKFFQRNRDLVFIEDFKY